jgi:hypothetical protein
MITDEQFKKTEGMLYRYYRQQRETERLKARIRRNEQRRDEIYKDIKETNITLETEVNMAVSYDEKVQTSNLGTSFAEKETVRQIEKLEKEWKDTRRKILNDKYKIREINSQNADIEYTLNQLLEEDKQLVELKYGSRRPMSDLQISMQINISESTVRRKRKETLEYVYKYMNT